MFFRFLQSLKIRTGSIAKQREVHRNLHGDDWVVEETNFVSKNFGKFQCILKPWAHITDLKAHIINRLDQLQR